MYCFRRNEITMNKFENIVNGNWKFSSLTKEEAQLLEDMRAKLFLSFDALTGLKDGVEEGKVQNVPKSRLSKDRIEALNYGFEEAMQAISDGKKVFAVVCHFFERTRKENFPYGYYDITHGKLSGISDKQRWLKVGGMLIAFDDVMDFSFKVLE